MRKGKLLAVLTTLVFLFMLSACGGEEKITSEISAETEENAVGKMSEEVITIKVGHIAPDGEAYALGFDEYAAAVEEATNGQVQFEIFGNGSLGGERELLEGVQLGTLDMSLITTGVVSNFVTDVTAIEFPFLFRDLDHAYKTLDGEVGQEILDKMSDVGFKGIAFWENGQRHFANSKHPIYSPEDLKGLKMRTIESEVLLDTYSALGTNGTPMAFPEVYGALQQNVIDGSDFSYGVIWSTNVYEQTKYFTEAGLYYSSATLVINEDLFESLPEDVKEVVVDLGREYAQVQREISQGLEAEQKQNLLDNGVEIISMDEVDLEAFREKVKPVYDKHNERFGHYIERIQNIN
ncbi:TRAP transporter substrate-binding protein DctP [Halalkalibacter alkalisediminis]|uniref:TRAP transporter substrate-binding protein DctP n=1 Tax=Halalkalibacter alkalisediminis TaxID=935616 RepID=A0ABV6NEH1_9BACI|nr:TRAP transporter substrate-binding protein DctP [Halalkalibacter alkalisediminis]